MENHATMLVSPDLKQSISASDTRMIIFSADSLRLMTTSEALRHDLNYSQAALNSMKVTDLLRDSDSDKFPDIIYQMQTNRTNDVHLNTAMQRSDGSSFSVALKLSLMQLQNSPVIVATIEAPQRQAMTRVSEREARLEQIVAKVPSLLFQMRQGSTGLIQFSFLSESCEKLLGIPPESLYANARQLFAQIIDEDRESWSTQLRESAEKLEVLNWEGRIQIDTWKDTKWISLRAAPEDDGENGIQWTGLMTNISHSKSHEQSLRQSRAELADLYVHLNHEQEEEHTHIRQTLHDDLGGNLSALKMMLTHFWETSPDVNEFLTQKPYIEKLISRVRQKLAPLLDDQPSIKAVHRQGYKLFVPIRVAPSSAAPVH